MVTAEGIFPKVGNDPLYNSEVNNFRLHRKIFTQATEYSTDNVAYQDVTNGSFTLSANGGIITKLVVGVQLKTSSANPGAYARLKISGSTLGTIYVNSIVSDIAGNLSSFYFTTVSGDILSTQNNSYGLRKYICSDQLKLLDDTTTFQLQLRRGAIDETVYIDEMEVTVLYLKDFGED